MGDSLTDALLAKPMSAGRDTLATKRSFRKLAHFTLRQRLLLLTTIALLPAFVLLVASQMSYRSTRSSEIDTYASHMTDVVLTEVIRGMTGAATMMVAAGRSALLDPLHADSCVTYLGGLLHDFPSVIDMAIAGPDKKIICKLGPSDLEAMQAAIDQVAAKSTPGLFVGSYRSTPSGPALPIGMALQSDNDSIQGFVELNAGVLDLQKLVVGANIPSSSSTIVADAGGTVLLAVPSDRLKPGDKVPAAFLPYVTASSRGTDHAPDASGRSSIIGYRPAVPEFPLAAVFALPQAEMMAPVDRDALIFVIIATGGAIFAFALAWFIGSRFIAAPVHAVHSAVSARRAGDRLARTGLSPDGSELGTIGSATDALFDELDRREELQAIAEQQRDIYAREVQHRVKNLLAIIQVTARQTLSRKNAAPEIMAFEGRIDAIVRANAKLLGEHEPSGTLAALLREATAPFAGNEPDRFQFQGPEVELRSKPALAIAMAMHELCTNAAKYGALSNLEGRVEIAWQVVDGHLELSWIERGGPLVNPPTRQGFGSMLITRALEAETNGIVRLEYAASGFEFHLAAPIQHLVP
jgi:two-component sensor histidine kinase